MQYYLKVLKEIVRTLNNTSPLAVAFLALIILFVVVVKL